MNNRLYMDVAIDKYELPLFVAETIDEMSDWSGTKPQTIRTSISQNKTGNRRGYKFVKVDLEEDVMLLWARLL